MKVQESDLLKIKRGRGGGTWAHWQLGLAYTKYLSPEFHIWCNEAIKEYVKETHDSSRGILLRSILGNAINMVCGISES